MKTHLTHAVLALLLAVPFVCHGQVLNGVHGQPNGQHHGGNQHANVNIDAENYTNTFKSTDIELADRGCDYVEAFYRLHEQHPHGNIFAVIKGISYDHIHDMAAMPSKSMIMISYGKSSKHRTHVAHVEDIEELGIRGVSRSPIHVYFPQTTDHTPHDHHHIHDVDDTTNHRVHPNVHINQVPHHHGHHRHDSHYDCEGDCD